MQMGMIGFIRQPIAVRANAIYAFKVSPNILELKVIIIELTKIYISELFSFSYLITNLFTNANSPFWMLTECCNLLYP